MLLFKAIKSGSFITMLVLVLTGIPTLAQVNIDNKIQLLADSLSERMITNIGDPVDPSDGINANTVQNGLLTYNTSSGTGTIAVNLFPPVNAYLEGMAVQFKINSINSGQTFLNINSLGNIEIKKFGTESLDSADLLQNEVIRVVYDGQYFQLVSRTDHSCPVGFVSVNASYCIEKNERALANYWTATTKCSQTGGRLCTWGEWYYACQKTSLGLLNTTNNYEWTVSGSNHAVDAWTVGQGGCDKGISGSTIITQTRKYRCCYSK